MTDEGEMTAVWEAFLATMVIAVWLMTVVCTAIIVWLFLTAQSHAAECLNKSEARAKYHSSHIWWHGDEHCWDNSPGRKPEISVEKATTETKAATVYYPDMQPGLFGFAPVIPLSWALPLYSPYSIATWPPMIDVDRVPFTAWSKRIGE
jgi:hypothetical protein